jgi:hypothetical protein
MRNASAQSAIKPLKTFRIYNTDPKRKVRAAPILSPADRVARFFLVHDTKTGKNVPDEYKMYQMNTKCTKWAQNIPNRHKIFQMAIKYINIFQTKALQNLIYPNWDFRFENKPSGNPGPARNGGK